MSANRLQSTVLILATSLSGCVVEDYGVAPFACARSPSCPRGYHCVNGVCLREGSEPSDATSDPKLSRERSLDRQPGDGRREGLAIPDLPRSEAGTPPVVLHQDSFDSLVSSLTGDGFGYWTQADGTLQQTGCLFDWTVATAIGKSWTNVEVAAQIRIDALCSPVKPRRQVGVIARTGLLTCESISYYYCLVDQDGFLEVGRVGTGCATLSSSKQYLGLPAHGAWFAISLTTVGSKLTCTASAPGIAPATAIHTDPAAPLAAGSAGLISAGLIARFDNFIVVAK